MRQIERGGLGKLAGEVPFPGTDPLDGGEQLRFRGHGTNSGELLATFLSAKQRANGGV